MDLRIVLLPNPDLAIFVQKYSDLLGSKYPLLFKLDNTHIPHVTLLHIETERQSLEKISSLLKEIAAQSRPIKITTEKILSDEKTFIGIYFKDNTSILALREKILKLIKYLIDKLHEPKIPHLTIAMLQNEADLNDALDDLKILPSESFCLDQIAICEQGDHGTCKNILTAFPLSWIK